MIERVIMGATENELRAGVSVGAVVEIEAGSGTGTGAGVGSGAGTGAGTGAGIGAGADAETGSAGGITGQSSVCVAEEAMRARVCVPVHTRTGRFADSVAAVAEERGAGGPATATASAFVGGSVSSERPSTLSVTAIFSSVLARGGVDSIVWARGCRSSCSLGASKGCSLVVDVEGSATAASTASGACAPSAPLPRAACSSFAGDAGTSLRGGELITIAIKVGFCDGTGAELGTGAGVNEGEEL